METRVRVGEWNAGEGLLCLTTESIAKCYIKYLGEGRLRFPTTTRFHCKILWLPSEPFNGRNKMDIARMILYALCITPTYSLITCIWMDEWINTSNVVKILKTCQNNFIIFTPGILEVVIHPGMMVHLQACLPKSTPAGFTVVNSLCCKSVRMTFVWAPPTPGSLQSIVGRSLADRWYGKENLQQRIIRYFTLNRETVVC